MTIQPWVQTHLLTWTPVDGGYPQRFVVMMTADPERPGQWWALRREDWPGTSGRWEFNLTTRKWFRLGTIASIEGRKGEWTMTRMEDGSSAKGLKLLS
jgi:hypothetical protein